MSYAKARDIGVEQIPVIDIAGLVARDKAASAAAGMAMRQASERIGFFYVAGHGLPAASTAGADPGLAVPYVEATPEVPRDTPIPESGFAQLAGLLAEIIRIEQPVHTDAVLERARILWGREKLEAAERAALQQALRLAGQLHGVAEKGSFWTGEEAPAVQPRDRRAAGAHLRRAAMIAPNESEAAARALLAAVPVVTEEELAAGVVRLLGLEANAGPAIAARVAALVGAGVITLRG